MSDEIFKDLALHSFRTRVKMELITHRHLPILPATVLKPTKCNCTPATCGCKKKKLDSADDSGSVKE